MPGTANTVVACAWLSRIRRIRTSLGLKRRKRRVMRTIVAGNYGRMVGHPKPYRPQKYANKGCVLFAARRNYLAEITNTVSHHYREGCYVALVT